MCDITAEDLGRMQASLDRIEDLLTAEAEQLGCLHEHAVPGRKASVAGRCGTMRSYQCQEDS
jgi:hypothetical protein